MKIAVAMQAGRLADHFGEAEQFAVFTATPTTWEGPDYHSPSHLEAGHDHEEEGHRHNHNVILEALLGCRCVISGGMGHHVAETLAMYGIEPVIADEAGTPEELARKLFDGTLRRGQVHRCCHG